MPVNRHNNVEADIVIPIEELCERFNINKNEVAMAIGVTYNTVYNWKTPMKRVSGTVLLKLQQLFQVEDEHGNMHPIPLEELIVLQERNDV